MNIKEVVDIIHTEKLDNMWIYFGDFLDEFYQAKDSSTRIEMVKDRPIDYSDVSNFDYEFIAASVNYICNKYCVNAPSWCRGEAYRLNNPHFSLDTTGDLRLYLILESPWEFKEKNIFTSRNTLDRV